MILSLLLCSILITAITPLLSYVNNQHVVRANQGWIGLIILACLVLTCMPNSVATTQLTILNFDKINLTLALQFDTLSKIMMIFILVIGSLIYQYAQHYLESDNTRMRFLSQFSMVLFSVLLLVMSANLLTAFIAWQLIGINLYLLLNHYHYDSAANRAAKKKFVINRIGDCTFLLAILLAYHSNSASSFAALSSSSHVDSISILIFISIMTKCAQFPFHVWLIDTMETPTPVSALMHAGIINAGGILLARISETVAHYQLLSYLILALGLLSATLSSHWMKQQPDTKRKLAYSTMGQMGYMLTQCSLGAFPAAIFHLISHGFYKASLFLNAGETLKREHIIPQKHSNRNIIYATIIGMIIFFTAKICFKGSGLHLPLIMDGFILITIITMVKSSAAMSHENSLIRSCYYTLIFIILCAYFFIFIQFTNLLYYYHYSSTIPHTVQIATVALLFILQYFSWFRQSSKPNTSLTDHTEYYLRYYLLNPLRKMGNIVNLTQYHNLLKQIYKIVFVLTIIVLVYGILYHHQSKTLVAAFLIIGIASLVLANRCQSIKCLIKYLSLFELAFASIALSDGNSDIARIAYFHIITIAPVLLTLYLLSRESTPIQHPVIHNHNNKLPSRIFYLVFSLLLLIGIPGTASFITEFYLLGALLNDGVIYIALYLALIILTAIVIMHSLQLYAFNVEYSKLMNQAIKKADHLILISIICLNVITGILPNTLLHWL